MLLKNEEFFNPIFISFHFSANFGKFGMLLNCFLCSYLFDFILISSNLFFYNVLFLDQLFCVKKNVLYSNEEQKGIFFKGFVICIHILKIAL